MTSAAPVARVVRISGALAEAEPLGSASMYELVRVGERGLQVGKLVGVIGHGRRLLATPF